MYIPISLVCYKHSEIEVGKLNCESFSGEEFNSLDLHLLYRIETEQLMEHEQLQVCNARLYSCVYANADVEKGY